MPFDAKIRLIVRYKPFYGLFYRLRYKLSCDRCLVDCGLAVLREDMADCRGWDWDSWRLEGRVDEAEL